MSLGHHMRLLWAEALGSDDPRTAVVIQWGDKLFGGVAWMNRMEFDSGVRHSVFHGMDGAARQWTQHGNVSMKLDMVFEWYEVVDSADAFRRSKRWQQARLDAQKVLEDKRGEI